MVSSGAKQPCRRSRICASSPTSSWVAVRGSSSQAGLPWARPAFFRARGRAILPRMSRHSMRLALAFVIIVAAGLPGRAQSRAAVTVADYERAERFLNYHTNPLVANGPVRANWLPGDRFWYRNQTVRGFEFVLVDAARATRTPAFNHAAVAATLTTALGKPVTADRLPFEQITFSADTRSFSF